MQTEISKNSTESLPGDFAIWIFIFAELVVFGVLFSVYAFARSNHVAMFDASQLTLNRTYGFANTLILLTSSYFVVRAVQAIKTGNNIVCGHWLVGSVSLGGLFLAIKIMEFHRDFILGLNLSSNLFYMFYLALTFFHFMHVVMGMVILSVITFKAYIGRYDASNYIGVETGGAYWHMVDLLWIILFALIYVIH